MADSTHIPAPPRRLPPAASLALLAFALAALLLQLELVVRRPDAARFSFDSGEYALAGRTLARTGRLATPFAHPAYLARLPGPPFPLLAGHPLVPLLDAAAFAIGGVRPVLTLAPAALAYLALVLLTAALARRVSASRAVPLVAAGALALAPAVLRFATDGRSELPFAALFTAGLVLLWDLPDRPRPALLGVLLGLAHLARPVLVPLLPAWLLAAWALSPEDRRRRTLVALLGGFVPFAAALSLYKWIAIGSPFADVAGTLLLAQLSPDFTIARLNRMFPPPSPWSFLAAHPEALLHKALAYAPSLLYAAFTGAGSVLGALFALRLVAPAEARERVFQRTLLAFVGLLTALALLTVPDPRMLLPVLPALVALGLDEAHRLARARGFGARGALALVVALALGACVLPALLRWREAWRADTPPEGRFHESEWRALGAQLDRVLPRTGLVASDAAPWVAWYAGRDATLVPLETGMLAAMDRRAPIRAIALTNEWLIRQPGEQAWRGWFEGSIRDPRWVRKDRVRAGRLEAVVFVPAGRR